MDNRLTILEILNRTTEFFKSKNIPDPRLDAQWILSHALGLNRLDLYTQFDKPLGESELAVCRELVKRRGNREPLQHILGTVSFRGVDLLCDKRALIPRPETELIIDLALKEKPSGRVLDLCTGSGAIAIALLMENPDYKVLASDISPEALELAKENAKKHSLDIEFHLGDLFSWMREPQETFDLILCNPPYIASSSEKELQQEVKNFDPKLALFGGRLGHEIPLEILKQSIRVLPDSGAMIMEIGFDQGDLLQTEAKKIGWSKVRIEQDFNQTDRFIILIK